MFLRLQISQTGGAPTNRASNNLVEATVFPQELLHSSASGVIRVFSFLASTYLCKKYLPQSSFITRQLTPYLASVGLNVASAQILGNRIPQSSTTTGNPITAVTSTMVSDAVSYGAFKVFGSLIHTARNLRITNISFEREGLRLVERAVKAQPAKALFISLAAFAVIPIAGYVANYVLRHSACEVDQLLGVENPTRHLSADNSLKNGLMTILSMGLPR